MNYTITSTANADYKERRTRDESDEKIVANYLDTYFYPEFCTTITRNYDKATQIKGLDVTVANDEYTITIDEKAATRWAGRNLQTFAHEISSVNRRGEEYDGWLLDFNSASNYLVEVWIDELGTVDNRLHTADDIKDCTVTLIPKREIYNYLKRKGVTSIDLRNIGSSLRMTYTSSTEYKGFRITCQTNNLERAANILIPRSVLVNELAAISARIKDGKFEYLRN